MNKFIIVAILCIAVASGLENNRRSVKREEEDSGCGDMFVCDDGNSCVDVAFVCDGEPDCEDGTDEDCEEEDVEVPKELMEHLDYVEEDMAEEKRQEDDECADMFVCDGGDVCLDIAFLCDGSADCEDGTDEDCEEEDLEVPEELVDHVEYEEEELSEEKRQEEDECAGMFVCDGGDTCVDIAFLCDGTAQCEDGTDEDCEEEELEIPEELVDHVEQVDEELSGVKEKRQEEEGCGDMFECDNGDVCLDISLLCDGAHDCEDGTDEDCEEEDVEVPVELEDHLEEMEEEK